MQYFSLILCLNFVIYSFWNLDYKRNEALVFIISCKENFFQFIFVSIWKLKWWVFKITFYDRPICLGPVLNCPLKVWAHGNNKITEKCSVDMYVKQFLLLPHDEIFFFLPVIM